MCILCDSMKSPRYLFKTAALLLILLPIAAHAQSTTSNAPMTAAELEQIVPGLTAAEAQTLATTGNVTSDYSGSIQARLAPSFAGKSAMIESLASTNATVGIELLFQAPIPPKFRARTDFWLQIYNIMRSISTLKGIEYYSDDRNAMRTFYYDAYVIPNPTFVNDRLPDPLVTSIPAESSIYSYHKDSTFGDYAMKITYTSDPGSGNPTFVRMAMTNETQMTYSIFPIVQPRHMQMDLVAIPRGNTMFFYGNFVVNTLTLFGLRDRVDSSFINRVKALYTWFSSEVKAHTPQ